MVTERDDQLILLNLEILAARKADFLRNLLSSVDSDLKSGLSTYERHRLHDALARIVAALDSGLFVSEGETKARQIDPSLTLGELELDSDKIWQETLKELASLYPELAKKVGSPGRMRRTQTGSAAGNDLLEFTPAKPLAETRG